MKNYNVWLNKDGKSVNISEMSDTYIENCIKMIVKSYTRNFEDSNTIVVFSEDWTKQHGYSYIKKFMKELRRRHFKREKWYEHIYKQFC